MPRVRKALVDEVRARSAHALVGRGWQKRRADIFVRPVTEEVIGWVGLNRATGRPDGVLEINPVIGVRHQPLERRLAELCGQKFSLYVPPTISRPLGYLMPQQTYVPWLFEPDQDVGPGVESMVDAIAAYGEPFIASHTTLEALVGRMSGIGFGYPHQLAYRGPLALALLGRTEEASAWLDREIEVLGSRTDPAAEEYRAFASRLPALR